jgi:hypothetical protein
MEGKNNENQENGKKRKRGGKLLALFLALVAAVGIVPIMSVSVEAETLVLSDNTVISLRVGEQVTVSRFTEGRPIVDDFRLVPFSWTVSNTSIARAENHRTPSLGTFRRTDTVTITGISEGRTTLRFTRPGNSPTSTLIYGTFVIIVGEPCDDGDCNNCVECGRLGGRFGFGNVTGGEQPAVQDALAILRQLVGLPSAIDGNNDARIAANIVNPANDGNPTVQDALQILRKLVGLPNMIDNPGLRV